MTIGVYYEHILAAARQRGEALPKLCAAVRAFGYEAVAPQAAHLLRDEALLPMLSREGLRAEGIYERFSFDGTAEEEKRTEQVTAVCERAGARYLLAVLPMLREKEADRSSAEYARRREALAQGLERLCAQAQRRGITVLLEPFDAPLSPTAYSKELLWYFRRIDGLFCAFDTGNPVVCGEDAEKILPALLPYIRIVHAKDRTFCANGMNGKKTPSGAAVYPAAAGQGDLPLFEILKTLRQSGFDGPVFAEHFEHADELLAMSNPRVFCSSRFPKRNKHGAQKLFASKKTFRTRKGFRKQKNLIRNAVFSKNGSRL